MLAIFPQGSYFFLHVFCFLQANVFAYLVFDFYYLRHSSFVWWPKLIAHIQELGIKKLIRGKKKSDVNWSSFSRLGLSTMSFTESNLMGHFCLFWTPPLVYFSLDSSENKISIFCLENISLNASILGSTGICWISQHSVDKPLFNPLFSVKYNAQEIPWPEIPCLALSSIINLKPSIRISCVSVDLCPVGVPQQSLWSWKNYSLQWFSYNHLNTNGKNVSCILWVINSRTFYTVFSGC